MSSFVGKMVGSVAADRHVTALCLCSLCGSAGISGLVGLMPIYLTRLGADAAVTGRFLAVVYLCLAASTLAAGRLASWSRRRKPWLILGGLLAPPLSWGMSATTSISGALVLMACLWFATGLPIALVSILTGRSAQPGERGRRFGALTLSSALGLLLGSLVSGPIVDRWGFSGLFTAFGAFYLLIPLAGLLVNDSVAVAAPAGEAGSMSTTAPAQRTFVVLVVASVLAQAVNIVLFLSRALIMDRQGYDATAISTASAVGTAVTLPLPLVLGWLADRLDRKSLVLGCFAAPVLGLAVQLSAVHVWQFWFASTLSTVVGASVVVTSAVTTDMFSPRSLNIRLALLNATPWTGIVLGLVLGGAAIERLDAAPALTLALVPGLCALLLVLTLPASIGRPTPGLMSGPRSIPSGARRG